MKLQIFLVFEFILVLVYAQDPLPDSNPDSLSCQQLRDIRSYIACCSDDTQFCDIQCNNGICRCVDPVTGNLIGSGIFFNEGNPNIDCVETFPEEPTSPPALTTPPEETTIAPPEATTIAPPEETTIAPPEETTVAPPEETTVAPPEETTIAPPEETTIASPEETTVAPPEETTSSTTEMPQEEPTEDEEDSESTGTSGSSTSSGSTRSMSTGTSGTTGTGTSMSTGTTGTSKGTSMSTGTTGTSRGTSMSTGTTGTSKGTSMSTGTTGTSKGTSVSTGTTGTSKGTSMSTKGGSRSRCVTVRKLLEKGCTQECLLEDSDGCPACNRTCAETSLQNLCASCTSDQVCLSVGRFGKRSCVDALVEGERCDGERDSEDEGEEDSSEDSSDDSTGGRRGRRRARGKIRGARDRYVFGELDEATPPCAEGLVCTTVALGRKECRPENSAGVCVVARMEDPTLSCADDGSFEALQCQPNGPLFECRCVNPATGMTIAGTMSTVTDILDAPDCENLVFQSCSVTVAGETFVISHGDDFLDVEGCQRCLCENGQAVSCEPDVCQALSATPTGCQYRGVGYAHREQFADGCNRCGCQNGRLECTHRNCEEAPIGDTCSTCDSFPHSPVCAPNGKTYRTECHALYCGGYPPFDLVDGPCAEYDVCERYPCPNGERCLKRGGISCLDPNGCEPDELRLCVDLESLQCDVSRETETTEDDTTVCGTNGETYSSLCELLQDTGNEGVAYAGECDREECGGGEVCGTDGVTYDNVCVLRSQSGNARLDYYGECEVREEDPTDSPQAVCQRVSRARRCVYNESNCRRLVRPEEGCCALCGGIAIVAIDSRGLGEFVRLNPRVRTIDDFVEVLVEYGFIPEEVTERCEVGVSFTSSENLEISLEGARPDDEVFCGGASERLVELINNPTAADESVVRPQVLQFAGAAVSSTPVFEEMISPSSAHGFTSLVSLLLLLPALSLLV